jgi:hypothetical protein
MPSSRTSVRIDLREESETSRPEAIRALALATDLLLRIDARRRQKIALSGREQGQEADPVKMSA